MAEKLEQGPHMALTHVALFNPHMAVIDREDHGRYHLFTPDDFALNGNPHDHREWGFWTTIKHGGYIEEVFDLSGKSEIITRKAGDTFRVEAHHIHRLISIIGNECLTHVAPDFNTGNGPAHIYKWENGIAYSRPVNGGEWEVYNAS